MVEFQVIGRDVIHMSRLSSERRASLLFPVNAMKAPEQMFFDHGKFRSSYRIKVVAAEVGIGDVVEFAHELTAPEEVYALPVPHQLWKLIHFILYRSSDPKYNSLLVLITGEVGAVRCKSGIQSPPVTWAVPNNCAKERHSLPLRYRTCLTAVLRTTAFGSA
jgi:hypothetical protein